MRPTHLSIFMYKIAAVSSYTYMGCFVDSSDRILSDAATYDFKDSMTPSKCFEYCQSNDFDYAGVQFGFECFCGSQEPCPFIRADESNCNMTCSGDSSFMCGAGWRSNVYTTSDIVEPPGNVNKNLK